MRKGYQTLLQQSHRNWFASTQLAALYDIEDEKRTTLPPIPEGLGIRAEWRADFAERPLLVYAGNCWPVQLPLLGKIARKAAAAGGQLLLMVKKSAEVESFCRNESVLWREPFRENREALEFLAKNAAGLLVSYAETCEAMPWIRTSFPSKLIEYTHLGLPILICSPEDSAVAHWARDRAYPDFATPEASNAVSDFVESLKNAEAWRRKAAVSRRFAEIEFDPARIQNAFEAGLNGCKAR